VWGGFVSPHIPVLAGGGQAAWRNEKRKEWFVEDLWPSTSPRQKATASVIWSLHTYSALARAGGLRIP